MIDWELNFGCCQHQGSRDEQQDFFAMSSPAMKDVMSEKGFLAVVADGMGGHNGGGQASYLAVQAFMKSYENKKYTHTISQALEEALVAANRAVFLENEKDGAGSDMGTTLLACVLQGLNMYWVSVGDSRLYLIRNGRVETVNTEHSYGVELDEKLKKGLITVEQAEAEAGRRHMLTSYVGLKRIPKVNASVKPFSLVPGDTILLCSDGLYNAVNNDELQSILDVDSDTQAKCEQLAQVAIAKNRPRQDNITAVLFEVGQAPILYEIPAAKKKLPSYTFISLACVALLLLAVGSYFGLNALFFGGGNDGESIAVGETDGNADEKAVFLCKVHELLRLEKFYQGELGGGVDEGTVEALKEYQLSHNLEETGILDKKTEQSLNRDISRYEEAEGPFECDQVETVPARTETSAAPKEMSSSSAEGAVADVSEVPVFPATEDMPSEILVESEADLSEAAVGEGADSVGTIAGEHDLAPKMKQVGAVAVPVESVAPDKVPAKLASEVVETVN